MEVSLFLCLWQALGLQDSDDEAEAEEKAVEEVSASEANFHYMFSKRGGLTSITLYSDVESFE